MKRNTFIPAAIISLTAAATTLTAQPASDPLPGDWLSGNPARPGAIVAQVIPRVGGEYLINFLPEFDFRSPPLAQVRGRLNGGKLFFDQDGWSGAAEGETLKGRGLIRDKETPFELKKTVRLSPNLGAKPSSGALALFDGSDLDQWEMVDNTGKTSPATWEIKQGVLVVKPDLGDHKMGRTLGTRKTFRDFQLHLEFRLPLYPDRLGQQRANSGVIFEDFAFYELQILDSYGLPGYYDDCGGIYKVAAPMINMCAPPLQWQSYDIEYHGPRFDPQGNVKTPARITVNQNGKLIHKEQELPFTEGAVKMHREKPETRKPGRIKLQDHGYPVEFRNIWLAEMGDGRPAGK